MSLVRPLLRVLTASQATGTHANAVATVAAPPAANRHVLRYLVWSYNGAPAGRVLIESPIGTTLLDFDVTAAGPGPLAPEIPGGIGAAMVGTLFDGGAGIIGKINLLTYQVGANDGNP